MKTLTIQTLAPLAALGSAILTSTTPVDAAPRSITTGGGTICGYACDPSVRNQYSVYTVPAPRPYVPHWKELARQSREYPYVH